MHDFSKPALRRHFREVRKRVTGHERMQAAAAIVRHCLAMPWVKQAKHIACYWPMPEECDTLPLIAALSKAGKIGYLPVMSPAKQLDFVCYRPGDAVERNAYAIFEPINTSQTISPAELDIVFMPLVAFDLAGHRLGMGSGHYDKALQFSQKKPHLIGLAYSSQQAERLPIDPWDVLLNGVVTEQGFLSF